MSVLVVVVLFIAAILLFEVAAKAIIAKEHECDCDGNCGDNCKCKDK